MKFIKALLLSVVILGAIGSSVAQKKSTLMGDMVIGELSARDEATHEVTIKYPGKEGPEIFTGILVEGYKVKMGDGTNRDFNLNEILPGMHIRVFYKSGSEKVNGQEKKINKISRLEFLGKDEFERLRNQLNVDPSTAVTHAEKDDLPAASPLKIYLGIAYGNVQEYFVDSIDKWNRKNGDVYGKLELVSDMNQTDIMIVVARRADTMVVALPADLNNKDDKRVWVQATSYLVGRDPAGLKVLWTSVVPVLEAPGTWASTMRFESVMAELEKRMKARSRNSKK